MIDTKINDDNPDENKEALKSYKVTLRSDCDVSVELKAASVDEARGKAAQWQVLGDGAGEFCGYWTGDDDHFVGDRFGLSWYVHDCTNSKLSIQVLQDDTWRPCIEDS